jgi:hypothetical protein
LTVEVFTFVLAAVEDELTVELLLFVLVFVLVLLLLLVFVAVFVLTFVFVEAPVYVVVFALLLLLVFVAVEVDVLTFVLLFVLLFVFVFVFVLVFVLVLVFVPVVVVPRVLASQYCDPAVQLPVCCPSASGLTNMSSHRIKIGIKYLSNTKFAIMFTAPLQKLMLDSTSFQLLRVPIPVLLHNLYQQRHALETFVNTLQLSLHRVLGRLLFESKAGLV